ncbi:MAG: 3-deoxy-7-phosphoheptulonate synthase [Firmicutes bacterium]|jgi:3-deoxy-7-phosphoheptulonate synthase|nr:3-deoxy-7-phosphoheptulonate synthase [Bacillota bacterium]
MAAKTLVGRLVSREHKREDTVVSVRGASVGGPGLTVIAGPCAVESREQVLEAARLVKAAGATILRGGAFKPRTSPYSFQGLGEEGLAYLAEAGEETGLPVVSEVIEASDVPLVSDYVDILQIGSRNMQNYALLRRAGKTNRPVLLKRGLAATLEEWLLAAEYIMDAGNPAVILCERGIRTYETATRNTLDLAAVPVVKAISHLPIIVDPCHASGDSAYVLPLAKAALGAGADGVMVEVHPCPGEALCDGEQSLSPAQFRELMDQVNKMSPVLGRGVVSQ